MVTVRRRPHTSSYSKGARFAATPPRIRSFHHSPASLFPGPTTTTPPTTTQVTQVWPVESDPPPPPLSRFALTLHRIPHPGELRETIAGYRACLILSGPVSVVWNSGTREERRDLLPGDVCTDSPVPFRTLRWDAPLEFLRLEISLCMMAELTRRKAAPKAPDLPAHRGLRDSNLSLLIQMLHAAAARARANPSAHLFCEKLGQSLAAYLYDRYCTDPAQSGCAASCLPGTLLKKVLAYIDQRITEPITVAELAYHAGMSQFYFSRLFRNTVGRSPAQYVLDCRIEHATPLLQDANLTLPEVARKTGFSNLSSFAAAFCARHGETPARHRRNLFKLRNLA